MKDGFANGNISSGGFTSSYGMIISPEIDYNHGAYSIDNSGEVYAGAGITYSYGKESSPYIEEYNFTSTCSVVTNGNIGSYSIIGNDSYGTLRTPLTTAMRVVWSRMVTSTTTVGISVSPTAEPIIGGFALRTLITTAAMRTTCTRMAMLITVGLSVIPTEYLNSSKSLFSLRGIFLTKK